MPTTYKVVHFKRCLLLNKYPVGYILTVEGSDNNLYQLWGTSLNYVLSSLGTITAGYRVGEYEDGFTSCVFLNGQSNNQNIFDLSNEALNYPTVNLDINFLLNGVTPESIDDGILQSSSGGSLTISTEDYKVYARQKGWLLTSTDDKLAVIATNPEVVLNFGSFPIIANFSEITMSPNSADPSKCDVVTAQVGSRVRWGDASKALCQIIEMEDADTNTAGYIDLIDTYGPITAAVPFEDRVVVCKPESIYELVYTGYPRLFVASLTVPDNGTIARESLKKIGAKACVLLGNDNIYIYQAGGKFEPIGTNIKDIFFGPNASYTKEQLAKTVIHVFDDREEIWLWVKDADSIVYKFKKGVWHKTDYSQYGYGTLSYLGLDYYYSSGYKGKCPIFFFGSSTLALTDSVTYVGYKKATLTSYIDVKSGVGSGNGYFETKDFPFNPEARVTELRFQAKSATAHGTVSVYYSIDEGKTWSSATSVEISSVKDFSWYSFYLNVTTESIRFKLLTVYEITFGRMKMFISQRKAGEERR